MKCPRCKSDQLINIPYEYDRELQHMKGFKKYFRKKRKVKCEACGYAGDKEEFQVVHLATYLGDYP